MFILFSVDNKHNKRHMEKYVNSHKKKLEILEEVLLTHFGIKSKDKLEDLICIYQDYVDKKKEEEKSRNNIILTVLSAMAGVLVISFENIGIIGIDFVNWFSIAMCILVFVAVVSICIYSYTYFDSLKRRYEMMIKDLKELSLITCYE